MKLPLRFTLGKNTKTLEAQYESRNNSILYVPDRYRPGMKPSEGLFMCEIVRTIAEGVRGSIVSVILLEELRPFVDEAPERFELELVRGMHPKKKVEQWQAYVTNKVTSATTLYVVDENSSMKPAMNGERFLAEVSNPIFSSPDGSFEIVLVTLVELLEAVLPQAKVVGSIVGHHRGRSGEKRLKDAKIRDDMKNAPNGQKKKSA